MELLGMRPKQQELIIRITALVLIYILAFVIRLFSVLRYESVIHEFDPWFNYRSTIKLVTDGLYEFWNWFDHESWYPLGRVVGGTIYPGLMFTAAAMYKALTWVSLTVKLRDVCVLTAPFFASNTAMVAYLYGKEVGDTGTGLLAAVLMAIVPGYISRSVAGSFDNEAVAIFALLLTFYFWTRAVRTGSIAAAVAAACGYFYMASAWGAYVFISNLIPLYVLVMLAAGRYTRRLYVVYTVMWAVGSLLAQQVRFIGFNHVVSTELLAFNAVAAVLQAVELVRYLKAQLPGRAFDDLLRLSSAGALSAAGGVLLLLVAAGKLNPWTGRFWTLLDPTYAKRFIPIVASVSEHQPTTWAAYLFDLHLLVFAAPAGLYFCFKRGSDAHVFLLTYALASIYFSGIMVRLMLVAAPAFVLLSAVALSATLRNAAHDARLPPAAAAEGAAPTGGQRHPHASSKKQRAQSGESFDYQRQAGIATMVLLLLGLCSYTNHCRWVTSEAYSSPSIVLITGRGPNRYVLDDFREAYAWLRHNTRPDARIMSWWDYGYQITGMGNRTIIVDNNTWNNTHIATVGRAMASNESVAYEVMRQLDVDYALVIFGGVTGYSSDDINKFLWMVRIGGGVFPDVKEADYMNKEGQYKVDKTASAAMLNSLMYSLSYYNFGKAVTQGDQPPGFDRVRGCEIGRKDVQLEHLEEAFTSQHWLVRIFKVKDLANRW